MNASTESVSPIDLRTGDCVRYYGAVFEVIHIIESPCDVKGGIRVAACISRLIGNTTGSIPRQWLETPEIMKKRGAAWASDLPAGLYWNIQGNAHARVDRVI
ncbi:hypothetical protein [Xenorhabdus bovienii]|uniref:hypothetical protein n=1 Tax=Xenorhabdus bovienii TaxID=40576 RepID=UPI0023B22F90|nr:hypothetical protein [Xenorhabdus bovienii]MDE9544161.1 hypothetical protein [Xenorhabdus bovienii]